MLKCWPTLQGGGATLQRCSCSQYLPRRRASYFIIFFCVWTQIVTHLTLTLTNVIQLFWSFIIASHAKCEYTSSFINRNKSTYDIFFFLKFILFLFFILSSLATFFSSSIRRSVYRPNLLQRGELMQRRSGEARTSKHRKSVILHFSN